MKNDQIFFPETLWIVGISSDKFIRWFSISSFAIAIRFGHLTESTELVECSNVKWVN